MSAVLDTSAILAELAEIKQAVAFRPGWITGYVALERHLGGTDKRGRKAKAWAKAEGLYCKLINGTPSWSLADVERAMRNGRAIETKSLNNREVCA